jgi:AraC-like DNA-binding protein
MENYIFDAKNLIFRHNISENIACGTYSAHIHTTYELIYFIGGDATYIIEGRKYKLKKHDLILTRPFQYHFIHIDSVSDYERYDILFDPERHGIEAIDLIPGGIEIINIADNQLAREVFKRCDVYRQSSPEDIFPSILSHLISELFYTLHVFPKPLTNEGSLLSPIISQALQYVNDNICSVKDVSEISEHLFISESYLFRLFKKELHKTPKQYICEKRLLMAQKMLSEGDRPTSVSERCGFSDYTTFYRNYVARFGYPPTQTPTNT